MTLDDATIHTVTEFAALAPSVHNTQPWSFAAVGHTIEVRADPDRSLSYLDPTGRQLHISCGMAIEFARLALRALGNDVVLRLTPDSGDSGLLARLTVGHSLPMTATERRWVAAIPRRYTDRGPYDDVRVPQEAIEAARDAAADRGCWLRLLDRPGDRALAAMLLNEAEGIEAADPQYREELDTWRRSGPSPDGIPQEATTWTAPDRVTDVPLRDFTGDATHPRPGDGPPPQVEHDTLILIGTEDESPIAWLRVGRALAVVLLSFTDVGVVAQPLGPVTDVPVTRTRLQRELGLLGHPQMLLRAGYGHGRPRTGRRDVKDMLTVTDVA